VDEFFEAPPPRSEPEESYEEPPVPPWFGPPRGVLPCAIPLAEVIARTDKAAIGIAGIFAYNTGFELKVFVLLTRDSARLVHPFRFGESFDDEGPLSPKLVRVGLEYSDGRKATNTNPRWPMFGEDADVDESRPTMVQEGGNGGEREWRQDFWCWPLPSPGPLQIVCEWPMMEIPLTRFEIGADVVLGAAARSVEIFPSD
jgi:hypothetical protein